MGWTHFLHVLELVSWNWGLLSGYCTVYTTHGVVDKDFKQKFTWSSLLVFVDGHDRRQEQEQELKEHILHGEDFVSL